MQAAPYEKPRRVQFRLLPKKIPEPDLNNKSRLAPSLDTESSRRIVLAAKFSVISSKIWSGLPQIRLSFGGLSYGPCRSTTTTLPEFIRKKETATAFEWMTPTTRTMSWTNL